MKVFVCSFCPFIFLFFCFVLKIFAEKLWRGHFPSPKLRGLIAVLSNAFLVFMDALNVGIVKEYTANI